MTTRRDPDAVIRSFLAEGQTQLPDRAYDNVRAQIDRTRQRVVVGPWKEPHMSTAGRLSLAAAAVVAVAVIGISVATPRVAGPLAEASAPSFAPPSGLSASSSVPTASLPLASPPAYAWPRALAAGTYTSSFIWDPGLDFTFTVPEGWDSRDINIAKGERMSVQFYLVENIVADVCGETLRTPPIETSPEGVANALASLVKLDAPPSAVTLGDRSGMYVAFHVGSDLACAPSEFRLFKLATGRCGVGCGGLGPPWKGLEFGGPEDNRAWILGVGRGSVVIDALWTPQTTAADLAELQQVIDSIKFATPGATPPPQPASTSP